MKKNDINKRKAKGIFYTPPELARFLAGEIIDVLEKTLPDKEVVRIFDPAAGSGELLLALSKELLAMGCSKIEATGYDTDGKALGIARERLEELGEGVTVRLEKKDFLESFIKGRVNVSADIIIANPPYVRTQAMGTKTSVEISEMFGLKGRIDLYYAFIIALARTAARDSVVGLIVSNRFMTVKSGKPVREILEEEFDIFHVWDMGDTRLFKAAVLPALLLMIKDGCGDLNKSAVCKEKPLYTSIYTREGSEDAAARRCDNLKDALLHKGLVEIKGLGRFEVIKGKLETGRGEGLWRITDESSEKWLERVRKRTFCTFGDAGKVRVGVKTTADNVFIGKHWFDMAKKERPELLYPLTTHHVARAYRPLYEDMQTMILYPYEIDQNRRIAIKLESFPITAGYLEKHRKQLEGRKYFKKVNREWFEIWVPHKPALWKRDKLVFRDIAKTPVFWLDFNGTIVNGDCYWMIFDNEDLMWLSLAIGNSKFILKYYDLCFGNRLYSGRRRFMTQYVEQFPLPDPSLETSGKIIALAKKIYELTPLIPPEKDGDDKNVKELEALCDEVEELICLAFSGWLNFNQ